MTLDKQLELYGKLHDAGYLTHFDDVAEMTEQEVNNMIGEK
jgi:hypothetical protein